MSASDYLENALLNHVFRNTAYTSPTTVYAALYTSNPGDDNSGAEVVGGVGYSRQVVTFGVPSNGTASSSNTLTFGPCTGSWGTVGWWAIFDASTVGNMLAYGVLAADKTPGIGDNLTCSAGNLTLQFT